MKPIEFITALRSSFAGSVQVYTMNSCYQLFLMLKLIYPQALCYWSPEKCHAITRIGGDFYDITGFIADTTGYYRLKKQLRKDFAQHHFSMYKLVEDVRNNDKAYIMFKKSQLTQGNLTGQQIFNEVMNESVL